MTNPFDNEDGSFLVLAFVRGGAGRLDPRARRGQPAGMPRLRRAELDGPAAEEPHRGGRRLSEGVQPLDADGWTSGRDEAKGPVRWKCSRSSTSCCPRRCTGG